MPPTFCNGLYSSLTQVDSHFSGPWMWARPLSCATTEYMEGGQLPRLGLAYQLENHCLSDDNYIRQIGVTFTVHTITIQEQLCITGLQGNRQNIQDWHPRDSSGSELIPPNIKNHHTLCTYNIPGVRNLNAGTEGSPQDSSWVIPWIPEGISPKGHDTKNDSSVLSDATHTGEKSKA